MPDLTSPTLVFEPDGHVETEGCSPLEDLDFGESCLNEFLSQDCFDANHLYMRLDFELDHWAALYTTGPASDGAARYGFWPGCPPRHHEMACDACSDYVCTELTVYAKNGLESHRIEVCNGPDESNEPTTGEEESSTGETSNSNESKIPKSGCTTSPTRKASPLTLVMMLVAGWCWPIRRRP